MAAEESTVQDRSFRIAQMLRDHAAAAPDDPALTCGERTVTYVELDRRSNRVAQSLIAAGTEPGARIPHLDRNGIETVELMFGAAKAGAAIVPLNWRLAVPELVKLVGDTGARRLFCGPDFADVAGRVTGAVDGIDELVLVAAGDDGWLGGATEEDPHRDGDFDAVVLQLYTSGTTGLPKGVQTTNANLSMLSSGVAVEWSLDDSSVSLVAMPLFHIGGLGWLLVGLSTRARNVLVREIEPVSLLDTIERERVSNAFLVPTVLQMMCAAPGAAERDYSALRSIAYGASPITTTALKAALKTFGCPLYQVYGMTETTGAIVQLAAEDHDPDGPREHLLRSAGRPYEWTELRIAEPRSGEILGPRPSGRGAGPWRQCHAGILRASGGDRGGDRPRRLATHRRRGLPR
jgi:acyl-CoA synthetase (AMP-forming)/AMP-acid ligase II